MSEQVSEFVILAGSSTHGALVYSRERLRCYLAERFPRFRFSLAVAVQEGAPEEFAIVPVVGTVGDGDEVRMRTLEDAALEEIREALEAFEVSASLLN
jgi:hypothetical protein